MELASKPAIPEPPIAVIGQLSENWRLGFRPAESTLFQGAMPVKYLNGIRDSSSVASNSWQMSLMAQETKPDASGTIKVDVWAPAPKDYAEVPRIMWSVVLKKNLRNAWLKATSPNNTTQQQQQQPSLKQKFCFYKTFVAGYMSSVGAGMASATWGGGTATAVLTTGAETFSVATGAATVGPYLVVGGLALWGVSTVICQ
jgi:hypothetical protein